jgi:hypothetical protein
VSGTYFSQHAAARHDRQLRRGFEDRLRHHGLNRIGAELAQRPAEEPPTFRDVAGQVGWAEAADRVNRWAANDYLGDWQDPIYREDPQYIDLGGGEGSSW